MAEDKRFLGTGCRFPLQIDPATGRFMTSSANQSVKESLYLILMTQKTERITRPGFGSNILSYTFMDTGATMLSIMRRDIAQTIISQEPRVSDVQIETDVRERQGMILINIDYYVAETNTRDNMVFPFYLDQAEEPEAGENEELDAYLDSEEAEPYMEDRG
ncbi:MAG: GPW/gp25 family protein [Lachnospiraceae bacterium]|jgi:phage baseplate assembly protein W|nr:GPW/gp25 family protein [Lachnospiraceae bacterium]MBQ7260231.1 GPW/gp25 family protein [Lachnospiraceae bacterium]HAU99774.1 baseplate protein [Lachnospiraceae bacterium]